jgi:L-seryl-tRNA(Ser) seleniumtransferase
MGFDFVVIQGGKAIRGPQSAGLLMGKKSIIEAARIHMPPRGFNIGRGMKVNKEEVVGMYVALEHYLAYDHDKEWKTWEERIAVIDNAVKTIDGVTTKIDVPKLGNVTPHVKNNMG